MWSALNDLGRGAAADVADALGHGEKRVTEALEALARRRVVARLDIPRLYFALRPLLDE